MDRMTKLALLESEVFRELEKNAQDMKQVVQETVKQEVKNLMNKSDDDNDEEEMSLKELVAELSDEELEDLCKIVEKEKEERDLDEEEDDAADMEMQTTAQVKESLQKIANSAAEEGDIEAAYLIERTIEKL